MTRPTRVFVGLALCVAVIGCKRGDNAEEQSAPEMTLRERANANFDPIAPVEVNEAQARLGERLYHDPNLSADGTISCASCHNVAEGGDDGKPTSDGIAGQVGPINSPTTLNSHLNFVQFWDGRAETLEEQALGPMANPLEMGFSLQGVTDYINEQETYTSALTELYDDGVTIENVAHAIAEYERTLTTPNSPFDQWLQGNDEAMSEQALAGLATFMDVGCISCHRGEGLGGTLYQPVGLLNDYFERRGGEITEADLGRFNVTGEERDRHRFKVPLLRNVELTAPYFHDGHEESLQGAIRTMAWSQLDRELSDEEVANIEAFLISLTGERPTVDIEGLNLPPSRAEAAGEGEEAPAEDDAGAETEEG